MELLVDRKWKKAKYTISNLYVDGKYFSNVLEDTDRGLRNTMTENEIKARKVPNETAIPSGTYEITLDVFSPRFGNQSFYKQTCNGKLPRLLNVKGFDGILIHAGNTASDTLGCLLVGVNKEVSKVLDSQNTFKKLYQLLLDKKSKGEKITIKIL